jgi:glucose-6-phosphate 1-dehydrogenase
MTRDPSSFFAPVPDFPEMDVRNVSDLETIQQEEAWYSEHLTVIVFGASGDLAKKKTYPTLFELYTLGYLPKNFAIWGFSRSAMSDEEFRAKMLPYFPKAHQENGKKFLEFCYYRSGKGYDDLDGGRALSAEATELAAKTPGPSNRLFYFAIPPTVFLESARTVKLTLMDGTVSVQWADDPSPLPDDRPCDVARSCSPDAALPLFVQGFHRVIVEKPFGTDLASAQQLGRDLGALLTEDQLYRIDHYLGKEMVQVLLLSCRCSAASERRFCDEE